MWVGPALPYPQPVFSEPPTSGLRLAPGIVLPEGLADFAFVASGGPGGQNVNKRATKCQLRVRLADIPLNHSQMGRLVRLAGAAITDAGEVLIVSDEHRSQGQNRAACIDRLGDLVRRSLVAPKVRRPTKPSRGSKERRLQEKKVRSDIKAGRRGME
jgi:ribosome-associated protein